MLREADVNIETRNSLLRELTDEELEMLLPHIEEQEVPFKQILYEQGGAVDWLYFPESGVLSMITDLDEGESVETGTVGSEGMVGLPAVLGVGISPNRVICQIAGRAKRLPAALVDDIRAGASHWFLLLLRYANFVNAMAAQTAACNRMHAVDARMSRWLLMTHDRVDGDDFPLTQEFLAQMLGAARPTVNIAGATLQKAGLIRYTRGRITVLDRPGLESASCECYRRIREVLEDSLTGELRKRARNHTSAPTRA
jgi:CRP-like cAMP-binding protein